MLKIQPGDMFFISGNLYQARSFHDKSGKWTLEELPIAIHSTTLILTAEEIKQFATKSSYAVPTHASVWTGSGGGSGSSSIGSYGGTFAIKYDGAWSQSEPAIKPVVVVEPKCECASHLFNSPRHSDWCPLYLLQQE